MKGLTMEEASAEFGARLAALAEAMVPQEWRDNLAQRGYVGNRCGWYPEKPRRKRRVTLR